MTMLTAKQKKFCNEYMIDLNAKQAAIRAGYSKNTAKEIGYENLTKPIIKEYIANLQKEITCRTNITVDFVLNGIREIALNGEAENNRLKAFDLLGRHVGIYENDKAHHNEDVLTEEEISRQMGDLLPN